ncbi:MAG: MFS transporter [Planctomycetales bacterium]|nr:MFS transporter [Planctomycetales bacterium]
MKLASDNSRDTSWGGVVADVAQPYLELPTAVHILCLGTLLNRAGSFVIIFLTIYTSEKLGFGVTFAANCIGVFGIGSIVASMIGGQLADRLGRKPVMLFALFGAAISLFSMSFASQRITFLLWVFSFSLTIDMYRPAASAMLGDLTSPAQRPIAFSLMYISFNLGFAVAAPIGGFLASHSFRWLFWGDAITTGAYGIIIVWLIRDTLPIKPASNQSRIGFGTITRVANDTTFLLFSAATLLTSIVFMQAFTTLPIYMKQLGYSEKLVGALLATNGVLIVICQIPITQIFQRFHRVIVIIVGELLIAVGFGLTTFANTISILLMTIVIWTLGEVVQAAFKQSLVADMAPADMRGRYMGIFSLCHSFGVAVGAPIGGQVLARCGAQVLWPTCFVVVLISVLIYCFVFVRMSRQEAVSVRSTA